MSLRSMPFARLQNEATQSRKFLLVSVTAYIPLSVEEEVQQVS